MIIEAIVRSAFIFAAMSKPLQTGKVPRYRVVLPSPMCQHIQGRGLQDFGHVQRRRSSVKHHQMRLPRVHCVLALLGGPLQARKEPAGDSCFVRDGRQSCDSHRQAAQVATGSSGGGEHGGRQKIEARHSEERTRALRGAPQGTARPEHPAHRRAARTLVTTMCCSSGTQWSW